MSSVAASAGTGAGAAGGSITTEILVDDKVVDTKTATGTSAFGGTSSYLFP